MAELKRTFISGTMNIDIDDRLIPSGQYRWAENINTARSENADVGALENVRGNTQIDTVFPSRVRSLTYNTVGSVRDTENDKVYWWFTSTDTEGIYEFDLSPNFDVAEFISEGVNPVTFPNPAYGAPRNSVSRILEFSTAKQILKLSAANFITGANIIDNLLYWTDGLNPPRKVNIERFGGRQVSLENQTIQVGAGSYYLQNNQEQYHIGDLRGNGDERFPSEGTLTTTTASFTLTSIPLSASELEIAAVMVSEVATEEYTYNPATQVLTLTTPANNGDQVRIAYEYVAQEGSQKTDKDGYYNDPLTFNRERGENQMLLSDVNPEYDINGVSLVDVSNLDISDMAVQPAFPGDLISVAKRPPLFPPVIPTPVEVIDVRPEAEQQDFTADGTTDSYFLNFPYLIDSINASVTLNGVAVTFGAEDDLTTDWFATFNEARMGQAVQRRRRNAFGSVNGATTDSTTASVILTTGEDLPSGPYNGTFRQFAEPITYVRTGVRTGTITVASDRSFEDEAPIIFSSIPSVNGDSVSVTYTGIRSFDASMNIAETGDYLYDDFVYFAYRYKYRDGEVTPLSPFSPPAFFPKTFEVDNDTGAIVSMVNMFSNINVMYDAGDVEVVEVELVVTSSSDITLKSLATINKADSRIASSTPYVRNMETFNYDNNKVYTTIPSDQLTRVYDDVPLRAQAQEIIGNRLVYGNYIQNYNLSKIDTDGAAIVPRFLVENLANERPGDSDMAARSVKADRDYQVGIVYLDREGRQTPVLLGDGPQIETVDSDGNVVFDTASSTVHVPFTDHNRRNQLKVSIKSAAPYWATHYRFFIKQTKSRYYNVFPKNVVTSLDGTRAFIQLDTDERNKVEADGLLILKGNAKGVEANVRRVFRVNPYTVDANGIQRFSFTQDEQGNVDLLQDTRGITDFDVPFDYAQEQTGNAFAQLETVQKTEVFPPITANAQQLTVTLEDIPEDALNVRIIRVVVNPDPSDQNLNEAYTSGQYTFTRESDTIHFYVSDGGVRMVPVGAAQITVTYDYEIQDSEAPARGDYYLGLIPLDLGDISTLNTVIVEDGVNIKRDNETIFETVPLLDSVTDIYYEHGETFRCVNGAHTPFREEIIPALDGHQTLYGVEDTIPVDADDIPVATVGDPVRDANGAVLTDGTVVVTLERYFSCFSYPNGVEETKIFGGFNSTEMRPGVKASTVNETYRQREQKSWLIHSGVYVDSTNLNRLNEFSIGGAITAELDVSEGSIQKIHSRNTNLIVFQEDKVKNVPIQKNLIQTAGGNTQLTTDSQFFGTESAYQGEYGISKNPESFATYGPNIYFADKKRGALCRLANQGITELSQNGVESYVRDTLRDADLIIGSYDDYHNQMHWSFRNHPLTFNLGNAAPIELSADGRPGPSSECNRNEELISFKRYFIFYTRTTGVVSVGDVVFIDERARTQFNGNYRWYRIQDASADVPSLYPDRYNRAIQISPYGVITHVEDNCFANQPPDLPRDSFDISSEAFENQFDACANGVVDSQAYHDGTNNEPINGNLIYEGRWDRMRSSRTCWYLISVGTSKYTIYVENGEVKRKLSCLAISAMRRAILGSVPRPVSEGDQLNQILSDLCVLPFANAVYWFDGENARPEIDQFLFENNHMNTKVTPNAYYAFADGYYVRVDADSKVISTGSCSERICFNNPLEILTQTAKGSFEFTFNGIVNTFTTSTRGTTPNVVTRRAINNAEIEYIVQGQSRYPRSGTFKVNAQEDAGTALRTIGTTYYDRRISDDNQREILSGDVVVPLGLGSTAGGTFTNEVITLPSPDNTLNLSEDEFLSYLEEDPDEVQVIVTKLCYRIELNAGLAFGWFLPESPSDTPPLTGGILCGNDAPLANDIYFDSAATPTVYFESQDLETDPWSNGAGTFGFSYVSPDVAESGGVVTEIVTVSATGERLSAFSCVADNDTYPIQVGHTTDEGTLAQQIACNAAEFLTAARVLVYSDQPLTNFSDTPLMSRTDPDNPGNPPTMFLRADGSPVADGLYTDGITIRRVTAGVVGEQEDQGCNLGVTATLTATHAITAPAGINILLQLQTDEGATATYIEGDDNVGLQDAGEVDGTFSISSILTVPGGFEFTDGPYIKVDTLDTETTADPDFTREFTDMFTTEQFDSGDGPTQLHHWTGVLTAQTDPTYTASLLATGPSGTDITYSGHNRVVNGRAFRDNVTVGVTANIGASIALSDDENTFYSSGPTRSDGSSATTFNFPATSTSPNGSVSWSGSVAANPVSKIFSLTGTTDNANTDASDDTDTITSGNASLTTTLTANSGWTLVSHTPGTTSQTISIPYATVDLTHERGWTDVVVTRSSFSAVFGASEAASCLDTASTTDFFSTTGTIGTGVLLNSSTSADSDAHAEIWLVQPDTTSGHHWSGTAWATFTCPDVQPISENAAETFSSGSSIAGACANTGGDIKLYLEAGVYWQDNARGTLAAAIHYREQDSLRWFSLKANGTLLASGDCPGVYEGTTGITELTEQAGNLPVSGVFRVIGGTMTVSVTAVALTTDANDRAAGSATAAFTGETDQTGLGSVDFGTEPENTEFSLFGRAITFTLSAGTYTWSVTAGELFGADSANGGFTFTFA